MTPVAARLRPPSPAPPRSVATLSARQHTKSARRRVSAASASHVRAASCLPPRRQPREHCVLHASGLLQFCGMLATVSPRSCARAGCWLEGGEEGAQVGQV